MQREMFVLGEAAKRIPADVRERHPEIDWRGLAGLRDVLAHHYFRIDSTIVWDVVVNEMPRLLERLRPIRDEMP